MYELTFLTIIFIIVLIILRMIGEHSEKQRLQRIAQQQNEMAQQQKEQQKEKEQKEKEKLQREAKQRQEAADKIIIPLRKRIKDFLRDNPGEYFDEMDLRQRIGISTASEDTYFYAALHSLPYEKGFRTFIKEIGYETYTTYYYYVEPDE